MKLGELKWPDVADIDKSKVVVVPIASMEQHGNHMPLLTDTILTTGVLEGVERELGDEILTLPPLWIGSSHHHLDFPGTVSLSTEVYIKVLCEILDCLIQAGFRKIVLLNGHGGNIVPGSAAITQTRIKYRDLDPLFLVLAAYWLVSGPAWSEIKEIESPSLNHACEFETSMCLYLRPELVDMDKAVGYRATVGSDYAHPHFWKPSSVTLAVTFKDLSENGAMGRPDLATTEKGEKLVKSAGSAVAAFVREMGGWDPMRREANPEIPSDR
jgi:creatinine amidohydrolase